jgi:hypothetical protein
MALRDNRPQTPRKGSTAGGCVSAIVLGNFLYIHNIEQAFNQGVMVGLCVFVVEKFDLYEQRLKENQLYYTKKMNFLEKSRSLLNNVNKMLYLCIQ